MKLHTATLVDRHTVGGPTIRARDCDSGRSLDLHVMSADVPEAASIWAGGIVWYAFRGARAVYISRAEAEQIANAQFLDR